MRVKLYFSVFISFCLIWGCNSQSGIVGKEDGQVISYMIDELAAPLIAPPPIGFDTSLGIPQKTMDSLNKIILKLWIHPEMNVLSGGYLEDHVPIDVLSKFNENDFETLVVTNLENINSVKGHVLDLADTVSLKRNIDFIEADQLFNFSRIMYGLKRDVALVDIGISRSGLAGFSRIYYLQRKKGQWRIIDSYEGINW